MQEAVPLGEGGMAAILGLAEDKIKDICAQISAQAARSRPSTSTAPANRHRRQYQSRRRSCRCHEGSRCQTGYPPSRQCSFPQHAHGTGCQTVAEVLDDITISDAKIPVVANVNGQIETSAADIKANLVKQAASPVLWIDCTKTMQAFGAKTFVEVGPGKTLCGFNRKIDRKIHSENVEDIPSLQKTLEFFQEVR